MSRVAFTAPHYLASKTGIRILRDGGSAIDAMVAAAATISVVYPHMNSLAGDGFWLIQRQGEKPIAIDACGRSANASSVENYTQGVIPARGLLSCITQAGTLSGWQLARDYLQLWREPLHLADLFSDAINYCERGFPVSDSFVRASHKVIGDKAVNQAFQRIYFPGNKTLCAGDTLYNSDLASVFMQLAQSGLNDFYHGELAATICDFFQDTASPLTHQDFIEHHASYEVPLSIETSRANLYNLSAPTQGLASLLILAIYDRLYCEDWDEAMQVHYLVEATKLAFEVRNKHIADPKVLLQPLENYLQRDFIDHLAHQISTTSVLPWPCDSMAGDTVWMGCIDDEGTMVSFIQSIYWEFGSGIVVPETGLLWNNRGASFSLRHDINQLKPGNKPLHTLNPAMAIMNDGRRMVYGTMGGEGQPQTQAAVFNQYIYQMQSLQDSIKAPRWLLGRTWGELSNHLKLESDFSEDIFLMLKKIGHQVEKVATCNELMGHAGAIVIDAQGQLSAATDPRSDGAALVEE